jgi:carboxylesterase type B
MVSHTANESIPFTPTTIATADDFLAYATQMVPAASNETVDYIVNELYPDVLDGTHPWYSEFGRGAQLLTDLNFACTTKFLAKAYGGATHNYIFAYPPAYHSADVSYTLFAGDTTTLDDGYAVNATLAYAMQDYIVQFAATSDPNNAALKAFPQYGSGASVLSFAEEGVIDTVDDMQNKRCAWFQQAMIDGRLT